MDDIKNEKKESKLPLTLGILSLVLWVYPLIGTVVSIYGIMQSKKALKISDNKLYKITMAFNIIGLIVALAVWGLSIYTHY